MRKRSRRHRRSSWAVIIAMLAFANDASALVITYSAADLADISPGQNLYRYDYSLDGFSAGAGFGFSILFDPTLFTALQSPPPQVGADWDIIALQPDAVLPDDGFYDALALVDNPAPLFGFTIEFVWLGAGSPGSQTFQVYDPSFAVVETGLTIPEPGTFALVALGLIGLALPSRRRQS